MLISSTAQSQSLEKTIPLLKQQCTSVESCQIPGPQHSADIAGFGLLNRLDGNATGHQIVVRELKDSSFYLTCKKRGSLVLELSVHDNDSCSDLRSAWYIEFLPTSTRGMLMAAYGIGWPIGRAVVILVAYLVKARGVSEARK